ncbi:MAG: peroxiredoxin family protein [Planctomycetota bacterium]|jgi:peroxiredoxin
MLKQEKQIYLWLAVFISAIILAVVVIRAVVNQQNKHTYTQHEHAPSLFEPFAESKDEASHPKISLSDVVRSARGWGPIFTSWYGQMAPAFKLVDINGKERKLSDYRGKDVMIILWATWCTPCVREIPHLIELRKTTSQDKLAMLGISYTTIMPPNTTKMVKKFAAQQKINYTVFSVDIDDMPAPYNQIKGIPSSFFISPEGKIKLATEGRLSLGAIRAILAAE